MLVIVLLAVSDLIFMKLLDMRPGPFQSVRTSLRNAKLNVLASLTRLCGVAGLALAVSHPGLWPGQRFIWRINCGSTDCSCLGQFSLENRGSHCIASGRSAEGFYFSVSLAAVTIYNDIDKTMVAGLATLEAAGVYAAAYRLIDVAVIPCGHLERRLSRFLSPWQDGLGATVGTAALAGSDSSILVVRIRALLLGAPLVPHILGHQYADITAALRWLALLPVLKNTALLRGRRPDRRRSPGNAHAHSNRRRRLPMSLSIVLIRRMGGEVQRGLPSQRWALGFEHVVYRHLLHRRERSACGPSAVEEVLAC